MPEKLLSRIASVLSEAKVMTAETHPIVDKFQTTCAELGLRNPPTLFSHPFWPQEGALSAHNAILLGPGFLHKSAEVQEFTLHHELAHLLRNDLGDSKKAVEHAADRLALQIGGSRIGGIGMVRHAEESFKEELTMFRLPDTGFVNRWANRMNDAAKHAELGKKYGSHAERLENILRTDLADRTHVERLVAEHNTRSFLPLP